MPPHPAARVLVPCPSCGAARLYKATSLTGPAALALAQQKRCKRCGDAAGGKVRAAQNEGKRQAARMVPRPPLPRVRKSRAKPVPPRVVHDDDLARWQGSYVRELVAAERDCGDAAAEKAFRARLDAEKERERRGKRP